MHVICHLTHIWYRIDAYLIFYLNSSIELVWYVFVFFLVIRVSVQPTGGRGFESTKSTKFCNRLKLGRFFTSFNKSARELSVITSWTGSHHCILVSCFTTQAVCNSNIYNRGSNPYYAYYHQTATYNRTFWRVPVEADCNGGLSDVF